MRILNPGKRLYLLLILLLCSCYKEEIIYTVYNGGVLNFEMTEKQELAIYNSRGIGNKVYIDSPLPVLRYSDLMLDVDQMATRGQNTINFRKKSFSVNLDETIEWRVHGQTSYHEKFKLMSLVFDYTYIENNVAFKLFNELGLWPLHTFYTEVALNGNHQGLYLFVPDPEDFCTEKLGANFVLRKEYHNAIRRFEINPMSPNSEEYYTQKYDSIYTLIKNYAGEDLYKRLSKIIDLENYFRKLAVDYLIRNGDYTDELYFYTTIKNGYEVFSPLPWDCDDIFAELPHEINRSWAPGSLFGSRVYDSMDDVLDDVGDILLFSIEEDLDYKIATDTYLYQKYLEQVHYVLSKIGEETIRKIFDEVYTEVEPFYQTLDLKELSQYDEVPTSLSKLMENLMIQ